MQPRWSRCLRRTSRCRCGSRLVPWTGVRRRRCAKAWRRSCSGSVSAKNHGDLAMKHGNPMEIPWKSHGNLMEILWKSYGNPMEIPWKSHGNPMEIWVKWLMKIMTFGVLNGNIIDDGFVIAMIAGGHSKSQNDSETVLNWTFSYRFWFSPGCYNMLLPWWANLISCCCFFPDNPSPSIATKKWTPPGQGVVHLCSGFGDFGKVTRMHFLEK